MQCTGCDVIHLGLGLGLEVRDCAAILQLRQNSLYIRWHGLQSAENDELHTGLHDAPFTMNASSCLHISHQVVLACNRTASHAVNNITRQ